jgi:hypothetical protein
MPPWFPPIEPKPIAAGMPDTVNRGRKDRSLT